MSIDQYIVCEHCKTYFSEIYIHNHMRWNKPELALEFITYHVSIKDDCKVNARFSFTEFDYLHDNDYEEDKRFKEYIKEVFMSSSLVWEPENIEKESRTLPNDLKFILRKRYSGIIDNRLMDEQYIPYLEGIRDAGINGAEDLIDAIKKYKRIILKEYN